MLESLDRRVQEALFDPTKTGTFTQVPRIGIILEYEKTDKIATVLFQDTGKIGRVAARDVEILKRAPENLRRLKALYDKKIKNT
tara:strand:- start:567 stop:818 length:252 start_codon:yes stop_codon:yes gene_type:complete